jgi:aromatic-L-amino-acid decarboxylase
VHARGGQQSQLHAVTNGADPRPDQDSQLSIKPSTLNAELDKANKATEAVYKIIEERKEFFLTSTVIGGAFAIRVASANPLAEEEYVRKVFAQLVDAAEQVLGEGST